MNAKTNVLRRAYRHLTVPERVQLVLEAYERDDDSEILALDNSCPWPDGADYLVRRFFLNQAACFVAIRLLTDELLQAVCFSTLAQAADLELSSDRVLTSLLERQNNLWQGFVAWCEDIGHDPRQVLSQAPLGPDEHDPASLVIHCQIDLFESLAPGLLQNSEQIQMWHDFFTDTYDVW
jgi:hypothetical protein